MCGENGHGASGGIAEFLLFNWSEKTEILNAQLFIYYDDCQYIQVTNVM